MVSKEPQKQFSTPPLAALAQWSCVSLGDVLSIILGPHMKAELTWLNFKILFPLFFFKQNFEVDIAISI